MHTYILPCDVQFLIGARSNNFAEIFEGLYFSVRKSVSLLGLLVFLILFWWVAYCLTCPVVRPDFCGADLTCALCR